MALKATIHKAELTISDMDRGYYATHALTIARHPSETEERMMVRLVAFALFAEEACGRADAVVVLSYGRAADIWWSGIANKLGRQDKLTVINLDPEVPPALAAMTDRGMRLQCTIQDGELWVTNGERTVHVVPQTLMGGRGRP
jgi:uncharacterized protein YaeQ